jgi:hypothetical protein
MLMQADKESGRIMSRMEVVQKAGNAICFLSKKQLT